MAPGDDAAASGGQLVRAYTGAVVTVNPPVGPAAAPQVMTTRQLQGLDEVIAEAEQASGLRFAAYLGDLGVDTRTRAEDLLDSFGPDAAYTVLVAVSPAQRVVEIVTGTEAALRISDRGARVAVLSMVASCTDGDLAGALTNGVRILADQAGAVPQRAVW